MIQMASNKPTKQKEPVIELGSLAKLDTKVGVSRLVYGDTRCSMDIGTTYKWGDLYQMFNEETFPKLPLLFGEANPDVDSYQ
jgi:hypothetical protein